MAIGSMSPNPWNSVHCAASPPVQVVMARLPRLLLLACLLGLTAHNRASASREAAAGRGGPAARSQQRQQPTAAAAAASQPTLHTLIATECSRYFTWQVGCMPCGACNQALLH